MLLRALSRTFTEFDFHDFQQNLLKKVFIENPGSHAITLPYAVAPLTHSVNVFCSQGDLRVNTTASENLKYQINFELHTQSDG